MILAEKLQEYDFISHVASDIATDELFLPTENTCMQKYLNNVSDWTNKNLMLLNEDKSKFVLFTRSKSAFTTRLFLNELPIEKITATKLLGVWLQEDLGWQQNTRNICKNAYSRMSILGKLKYVGVNTDDLLTIYKLFIRCIPEYCSIVFHSSLTQDQSHKIERIQANSLKIILDDNYVSYEAALEMCNLETLSERREKRQLSFSQKCLENPFTKSMFPSNEENKKGKFVVNFARTEH